MTFEQIKTGKAIAWTAGVHVILLLIFLLWRYRLPAQPMLADTLMEVTLEGGEEGGGGGSGSAAANDAAASAENADDNNEATEESEGKNIMESEKEDAPVIAKKPVAAPPKTPSKNLNTAKKPTVVPKKTTPVASNTTKKAVTPAPPTPKPKYQMSGGAGNGNSKNANGTGNGNGRGNGSGDGTGIGNGNGSGTGSGNGSGNGNGAGGVGTSYRLGNRKMVNAPDPVAVFNEGGKVIVKVTVNREGRIVNYRIQSASNATIRKIAEQKIKSVRFNADNNAPVEAFGDITFVFKATRK